MATINAFLLKNNLRIATNPCVSPDFCLDWTALAQLAQTKAASVKHYALSLFHTVQGQWTLFEDTVTGDCGWLLKKKIGAVAPSTLEQGIELVADSLIYPASFVNLLALKNLIQAYDNSSTIFPTAGADLGKRTLGIGARFTTLHWIGVEWAMAHLNLGVTANQNSIPRELVYDVNAMLEGRLDSVPFPFIGTNVPEGHQGQSVEGMSHGCVLSKLKTGFHRRKIAWSFNADHQPIGGKFDSREDQLVTGCLLASYITFDLSPELAQTQVTGDAAAWVNAHVPANILVGVKARVASVGLVLNEAEFAHLVAYVWPAMKKMKQRDTKYRLAREKAFTTQIGRDYLRELSIDELPGLTTQETTAVMLALCEALEMKIHFVAPAFGFQKNMPYPDNSALKVLIEKQWAVCSKFDSSIGFHSGSGKSAENYRIMGEVTGRRLEIKTSGRYTYEMGKALALSKNTEDQSLWNDWYIFTLELALLGAFSTDSTEQKMARIFISDALSKSGKTTDVFETKDTCRKALEALSPSPEHMFWFEYNFLYVLAGGGRAEKSALGDHTPAGYIQRARFYSISEEGRLNFARNVANYIIFLAETTGLASEHVCSKARASLANYKQLPELVNSIAG